MIGRGTDVEAFLAGLGHPRRAEIDKLRRLIAGCGADVDEHVKWNAPSFRHGGDDRVTLRLQPHDRLEMILHRGAKKRTDAFAFDDPSGLVAWAATDRGVVSIPDETFLRDHHDDLAKLVAAWLAATADSDS